MCGSSERYTGLKRSRRINWNQKKKFSRNICHAVWKISRREKIILKRTKQNYSKETNEKSLLFQLRIKPNNARHFLPYFPVLIFTISPIFSTFFAFNRENKRNERGKSPVVDYERHYESKYYRSVWQKHPAFEKLMTTWTVCCFHCDWIFTRAEKEGRKNEATKWLLMVASAAWVALWFGNFTLGHLTLSSSRSLTIWIALIMPLIGNQYSVWPLKPRNIDTSNAPPLPEFANATVKRRKPSEIIVMAFLYSDSQHAFDMDDV